MLLQTIISILHADIYPQNALPNNIDIKHLLIDSRKLNTEPEHTLFFGLHTSKDDGAKYVIDLIHKGVHVFVINQTALHLVENDLSSVNNRSYTFLLVNDALDALQQLAIFKRKHFNGTVIGITGSHGKTMLKEMLYDLLNKDYNVIRSPKSYNSQIGVPLSVWQLPETPNSTNDIAIFEVGISQPNEMDKLEPIVQPSIGVLTNIGNEHNENFTSIEEKIKEKRKLFKHSSIIIEDPREKNVYLAEKVMLALGYSQDVIYDRLATRTHETKLYINLSSLIDNVRYFRSFLAPSSQLVCMVKASSYGLGSVPIANALQNAHTNNQHLVQYLGVAIADEGIELRRNGITLPIIVMTPEYPSVKQMIEFDLQPNIHSFDTLRYFLDFAKKMGVTEYPIHIKIDSGMHRLGFYTEELPQLASLLQTQYNNKPILKVHSVFSHLACADDPNADDFTMQQINYFQQACQTLIQLLNYPIHHHICNSAGIERFPQFAQDMCRLGIGMYGFSALNHPLHNVCSLKTTIIAIKHVQKNEYIGYNCKTQLHRDSTIAVIPIGYADGLNRKLSNYVGHVIVRQKKCPIIGNICMDQAIIDITDTDATIGDQVTIFGNELTINELANTLQTIPYEIISSLSRRIKREYFYE